MSHFSTFIVVPKATFEPEKGSFKHGTEGIRTFIENQMEKFSENREVESYDRDCYCVGQEAKQEAQKQAEQEFGTWDELRKKHDEYVKQNKVKPKETQKVWEEKFWKPRIAKEKELFEQNTKNKTPKADCEECKGTGKEQTTYNPESKWDWFRIGGRWDGFARGASPCTRDGGFNFEDEHETVAWNSIKIVDLLKILKKKSERKSFALVDSEGNWHEQGQMGWWGMTRNEKEEDVWGKEFMELLSKEHPEDYLVCLDCHI